MGSLTHTVGGTDNLVNFKSAARVPIESLKVHFSPIQEGEGDPSPENVRPISGWDGIEQYYSGKNIGHIMGYSAGSAYNNNYRTSGEYGNTISTIEPENLITITQTQWPNTSNIKSYQNGYFCIVFDNLHLNEYYDFSCKITNITNNPLGASLSNFHIAGPAATHRISPSIVKDDTIIFKNLIFEQDSRYPNYQAINFYYCGMSFTISDIMITPANTNDGVFEPYAPRRLVNWNQWLKPLTAENWQAYNTTNNDVQFENGVATSTWLTNKSGYSASIRLKNGILQKTKEIWYISYMLKSSMSGGSWGIEYNGGLQNTLISPLDANVWVRCSECSIYWRGTRNYVYIAYYRAGIEEHTGMVAQVKAPLFINLTQMFGPGNEPTKEEFEEQCALNGIDLTKAFPYDEGSVREWKTNGKLLKNNITFPVLGKNKFNINAPFAEPSDTTETYTTLRTFQPYTYCLGLTSGNGYFPERITNCSISDNTLTFSTTNISSGIGFAIPLQPGSYKLTYTGENISIGNLQYDSTGNLVNCYLDSQGIFNVNPNTSIAVIIFKSTTANTPTTVSNIQIEEGITATEYEEFNPNHTVYGGYVDLAKGEVVATYFHYILNGTETGWSLDGSGDTSRRTYIDTARFNIIAKAKGKLFSNYCKTSSSRPLWWGWISSTGSSNSCHILFYVPATIDTKDKWKTYLAENPLEIVYELAEPIHYPLTPNQLTTFLNTNNFWSNTNGPTEVSYAIHDSEQIRSTRKRILAAAPKIEEVSGSIATFNTDISAPLKECKVHFGPVQDLHGYSNPWPAGGGRNIFHITAQSQTSETGVVFTVNSDGSVKAVGNPSISTPLDLGTITLPAGTYKIQGGISSTAYLNIPSKVNSYGGAASFTIAEGGETITPRIYITANNEVNGTFYPMIKAESDNNADWAPYENICPIEGWEEIKIWKTNKNLIDLSAPVLPPDNTASGVTQKRKFTPGTWARGVAQNNHWSSTNGNITLYNDHIVVTSRSGYGAGFVLALPAEKTFSVIANVSIASYRAYAIYYKNDGTYIDSKIILYQGQWRTFTVPNDCVITIIGFITPNVDDYGLECTISNIQLESSLTSTDYESYQGQTIPITFPSEAGTVYGGYIDLVKGKLIQEWVFKTFTWGSIRKHLVNDTTGLESGNYQMSGILVQDSKNTQTSYGNTTFCNICSKIMYQLTDRTPEHYYVYAVPAENRSNAQFSLPSTYPDELEIQLACKLLTPIEYTLTPETLKTLCSTNNIWSSANGDIEIKYWSH